MVAGSINFNHTATDAPTCPRCAHEHQDAFEWSDTGTRNCHKCRQPFKWEREVEVTYSTEAVLVELPPGHASDCAVHNAPALPVGPCDCGYEISSQSQHNQGEKS